MCASYQSCRCDARRRLTRRCHDSCDFDNTRVPRRASSQACRCRIRPGRSRRALTRLFLERRPRPQNRAAQLAVLAGPNKLFLVTEAAAMVPAFVGRSASTGVVLARIGTRAVFSGDSYDRNAADLEEDADQENGGKHLLGKAADRFSWEPNAHAKNPPLSPEATERTAPVQTLACQNRLVPKGTSIIPVDFLNSERERRDGISKTISQRARLGESDSRPVVEDLAP